MDTKDFQIDIKPFNIENQVESMTINNSQVHHKPYDWVENIEQEVKQEMEEIKQDFKNESHRDIQVQISDSSSEKSASLLSISYSPLQHITSIT